MNRDVVVMYVVDRQRSGMVLDFFTEGVRQSREPAHRLAHREVN